MTMVSKIDHEGSFHWLNGDPRLPTIPGSLEATNLVLEQKGNCAWVSVALEAKGEVGLGAFWVEIHHNFLVHVYTRLCQCLCVQSHGF